MSWGGKGGSVTSESMGSGNVSCFKCLSIKKSISDEEDIDEIFSCRSQSNNSDCTILQFAFEKTFFPNKKLMLKMHFV